MLSEHRLDQRLSETHQASMLHELADCFWLSRVCCLFFGVSSSGCCLKFAMRKPSLQLVSAESQG